MTLDAVKTAAVITAADLAGVADERLHGHVRLELRSFVSVLARERAADEATVLGQLLLAGIIAEGFVLTPPSRLLELTA